MSININILADAAVTAGQHVRQRREQLTANEVFHKDTETDIVTVADRESEVIIREKLQRAYPEIAFYGEEGSYGSLNDFDRVFVVDPIDGTTSYLHGYPFYCVSIGLRENGQPMAGVIYLPELDELFIAEKGQGAFKNGRRIHVSSVSRFIDANVASGFGCVRAGVTPNNIGMAARMIPKIQGFRRTGSAAIDLCHVAEGCIDLYWEFYLKPWDYTGGSIIVREAGGRVTGFDAPEVNDANGRIIASNGLLHDEMVENIRGYLLESL